MTAETGKVGRFSLGSYTVDLDSRRVHLGANAVDLSWRHFEALRMLMEAGGEPVERERLLERLWPGVTVEESSLTQCISQLRKALGDTPEGGLIHTVARRGYRLGVTPVTAAVETGRPQRTRTSTSRLLYAALILVVVALSGAWIGRRVVRHNRAQALVREGLELVRKNQTQQAAAGNALLQQALELAPDLAIAYAGLAEGMARSSHDRPGQAKLMGLKALELDSTCADCLAIAGWILMSREWENAPALRYLSEASRRKPDDPRIRLWHAQILAASGKFSDALTEADAAVGMQPGNASAVVMRAGILYLSERYDEAILEARRALAYQPAFSSAWLWIYRSHAMKRQFEEALAALSAARRLFTGMAPEKEYERTAHWHHLLHKGGIQEFVRAATHEESGQPIKNMMRYEHATWLMWTGDRDGALDELENIFAVRPYDSLYIGVDPAFASLRGEPRFGAILAKMAAGRPR